MSEKKIQCMLDEIREIAACHSGERVKVEILNRNNVNYIQITISNKTSLNIEFHRTTILGSSSMD